MPKKLDLQTKCDATTRPSRRFRRARFPARLGDTYISEEQDQRLLAVCEARQMARADIVRRGLDLVLAELSAAQTLR